MPDKSMCLNANCKRHKLCYRFVAVPAGIGNVMATTEQSTAVRTFATGATRNDDTGKPDYAGYLCPLVIKRYGEYMLKHQKQADGKWRDSDNWKKGFPRKVLFKSMFRHVEDVHLEMDGHKSREGIEDALCAIIFNAQALLREVLLKRNIKE